MKKIIIALALLQLAGMGTARLHAQTANEVFAEAARSTTRSDAGGNVTTTYYDRHGAKLGTATTSKATATGNQTTVFRDKYGNRIGTASSQTSSSGRTTTTYRDKYGNKTGVLDRQRHRRVRPVHHGVPRQVWQQDGVCHLADKLLGKRDHHLPRPLRKRKGTLPV